MFVSMYCTGLDETTPAHNAVSTLLQVAAPLEYGCQKGYIRLGQISCSRSRLRTQRNNCRKLVNPHNSLSMYCNMMLNAFNCLHLFNAFSMLCFDIVYATLWASIVMLHKALTYILSVTIIDTL